MHVFVFEVEMARHLVMVEFGGTGSVEGVEGGGVERGGGRC